MTPKLSIIIISYNMAREVPRTVESLLPPYQQDVQLRDYEIIVMENGSSQPIPEVIVQSWPPNVRYISVANPQPSPASALNEGMRQAQGAFICSIIDGARMASPGLISQTLAATALHEHPIIATIGLHLGPKRQQESTREGYCQAVEDELLDRIDWRENGYELFNISAFADSAPSGWLGPISESNAITVSRQSYERLGGFDADFAIPGGGIVNLDYFKRAIELPGTQYILLLGEATFHQVHGGVTTSTKVSASDADAPETSTWDVYADQYLSLRGHAYEVPDFEPVFYGNLSVPARAKLEAGLLKMQTAQRDARA